MTLRAFIDGFEVSAADWSVGTNPDRSSWASFTMWSAPKVGPHDRVTIADDRGRPLWTGLVQRVTSGGHAQVVDVVNLTAVVLGHRINAKGEYDPVFRYGDVVQFRDPSVRKHRYMVLHRFDDGWLSTLRITPSDNPQEPLVFNCAPAQWELAE